MLKALRNLGLGLTRVTERYVPDAWIIALVLTAIVGALALTAGGAGAAQAVQAWGKGFWKLLELGMQFTLILTTASACASAPSVRRLLDRLARLPDPERPWQAILLMGLFSIVSAYVNWAFNLAACALFVSFVARNNRKTDYRLLVATAYIGIGTVWHAGLSGSAPLILATPGNFLLKGGVLAETISTSRTLFAPFNIALAAVLGGACVALASVLSPPEEKAIRLSDEEIARISPESPGERGDPGQRETLTPARKLERWRGWNLIVALAIGAVLFLDFREKGVGKRSAISFQRSASSVFLHLREPAARSLVASILATPCFR